MEEQATEQIKDTLVFDCSSHACLACVSVHTYPVAAAVEVSNLSQTERNNCERTAESSKVLVAGEGGQTETEIGGGGVLWMWFARRGRLPGFRSAWNVGAWAGDLGAWVTRGRGSNPGPAEIRARPDSE
jgi:hypothetical protein